MGCMFAVVCVLIFLLSAGDGRFIGGRRDVTSELDMFGACLQEARGWAENRFPHAIKEKTRLRTAFQLVLRLPSENAVATLCRTSLGRYRYELHLDILSASVVSPSLSLSYNITMAQIQRHCMSPMRLARRSGSVLGFRPPRISQMGLARPFSNHGQPPSPTSSFLPMPFITETMVSIYAAL